MCDVEYIFNFCIRIIWLLCHHGLLDDGDYAALHNPQHFLKSFNFVGCLALSSRQFWDFFYFSVFPAYAKHALHSKLMHYALIHISLLIVHLKPKQHPTNNYYDLINRFVSVNGTICALLICNVRKQDTLFLA
jgi:hypothetical protein